jgi:pyrroloquinoline quinone biosynthesis protein E
MNGAMSETNSGTTCGASMRGPMPLALIAELTHRCPLRCTYCSNPLQLQPASKELDTAGWQSVFRQAAEMGVMHAHFTGGEPLVRGDLEQLISSAHEAGLYTNLITSGIGLTERRMAALEGCGLDHFQLSFQDSEAEGAAAIAGVSVHERKVTLARRLATGPFAFTINLVVHRQNLDRIEQMLAFVESFSPTRVEIANVQYYGWGLENRALLMPTREQVEHTIAVVTAAQERLRGRISIDFVLPDYHARFPKACMGGWGQRLLLVDPLGDVLPCHAAKIIPEMRFENVRSKSLREIWESSEAFQRFRGEEWMEEPCRSCERRTQDHGGCRCQAFLLTGRAEATDPVCSLSADHALVTDRLPEPQPMLQLGAVSDEVATAMVSKAASWKYRVNPS